MTQVDFNVIVAITSIGIWSKIIQTHFLLTQDLIITSSIIHSCSENAFLQCMISGSLKCQDEDYQHIDVGCCCGGWKDRDTEVVCPLVMKMFRWVYDGGGEDLMQRQ